MRIIMLVFLLAGFIAAQAEDVASAYVKVRKTYRYRVYLKDKKNNPYSVKHPEAFLSQKALDRRSRYGVKVDEKDLPVTPLYLEMLRNKGFKVLHTSKWNNTVVVETADTLKANRLPEASFVNKVCRVWIGPDSVYAGKVTDRHELLENRMDTLRDYYGKARHQIDMLNGVRLHDAGFRGEGVTIAVVDGGFYNADCIAALKNCKILGTKNFAHPDKDVYEEQDHGMMVLSCIGTNVPYSYVGTAPEASFYLIVSEEGEAEYMVEEDNWCAAIEYADSVGADIVTSSLGYYAFDDESTSHKYHELDGRTAINSRSASLAASRGLLVLNSAGNAGAGPWKKIGFPADASDILTVGAVKTDSVNTVFSSVGNTADGRIKPDVMALGQASQLLVANGTVGKANGTSFSTPILCGAVACLVQAFPNRKPQEIIEAVRRAGDNSMHPDNIYGYGIPDMWKAYEILKKK